MKLCTSRNKLVTFRLTEEEFDAVRELCISKGFRSISELTRESLLQQLSGEREPLSFLASDLVTLLTGLQGVDEALKDLRDQIAGVLGPSSSHIAIVAPNKKAIANGAAK